MQGTPRRSTAVSEGTIPETQIPAIRWGSSAPGRSVGVAIASRSTARARRGPRRQAAAASCSMWSPDEWMIRCGTRELATTSPSSATASALTEVVPMSIPTVRVVMVGHYA